MSVQSTTEQAASGLRSPIVPDVASHTPGPWFVSGVRVRMNGGEWHSVNRYDEAKKQDENIACVGYDARTGLGWADARLIAAAPDLLNAAEHLSDIAGGIYVKLSDGEASALRSAFTSLDAAIAKARGEATEVSDDR